MMKAVHVAPKMGRNLWITAEKGQIMKSCLRRGELEHRFELEIRAKELRSLEHDFDMEGHIFLLQKFV